MQARRRTGRRRRGSGSPSPLSEIRYGCFHSLQEVPSDLRRGPPLGRELQPGARERLSAAQPAGRQKARSRQRALRSGWSTSCRGPGLEGLEQARKTLPIRRESLCQDGTVAPARSHAGWIGDRYIPVRLRAHPGAQHAAATEVQLISNGQAPRAGIKLWALEVVGRSGLKDVPAVAVDLITVVEHE